MSFATLALLLAVGLAGPLLAALPRGGPPLVVGEIAAGVVVGRSGLHLVDVDDPTLGLLSQTGFALLMLIVGTHLPIRRPELRPALRRALVLTAVTVALAGAVAPALDGVTGLGHPGLLAVLLASSSAAVALPVLQSLGRDDLPALVTTAWIALTDLVSVLAVPLVLRQGSVGSVLAGMAAVLLITVTVYLLARRLARLPLTARVRDRSARGHWALDLRVSLIILFCLAAVAEWAHTGVLVAGFAAGALLAVLGEPRRLAEQLIGLGEGFLVPVFFVTLGARIDLGALVGRPRTLLLAAVIAAGALAVHAAAARAFRLPPGAGALATAQLGVPSAVASIGLTTGALDAGEAAAVLAAALLSLAVCAAGAARLGHRAPLGDRTAPDRPTLPRRFLAS